MAPTRSSTSNDRIKELIKDLDMSQIEFCKRTGIKASALSNYLNGNRVPRQDAIMRIADAFNVSASWLMGYDVPRDSKDRTTIGHYYTPDKIIEQLVIYGVHDRLALYSALITAADGCDPEQIKPLIEALKAISKANKKDTT